MIEKTTRDIPSLGSIRTVDHIRVQMLIILELNHWYSFFISMYIVARGRVTAAD